MKENCKHEIKVSGYDIFAVKSIFEKEFKCLNCKKKIQMKVSRISVNLILMPIAALFGAASFFLMNIFSLSGTL